jgi:hypothetical protein
MTVFVSYAAEDERLTNRFIELLKLGVGVSHDQIFCTANRGTIANGEPFPGEIWAALNSADLVLAIVSPAYQRSEFCLGEAGAAMSRQKSGEARFMLLIVPPTSSSDLANGVFAGLQYGEILNSASLSEIYEWLKERQVNAPKIPAWVGYMEAFLRDAGSIIEPPVVLGSSKNIGIHGAGMALGSPLLFDVATTSVSLRAEGLTELIGDITLKCTCSPNWTGPLPDAFSVQVTLGTNITSRVMAAADAAPMGDAILIKLGRVSLEPSVRSKIIANMASFEHVGLENIQPGETRYFQISNLRCNASMLGRFDKTQGVVTLLANVSVSGFPGCIQAVGQIETGLGFEVLGRDGNAAGAVFSASAVSPLPPTWICALQFAEGFPHAFKTRVPSSNRQYFGTEVENVHVSESAEFGQVLQDSEGKIRSTSQADHGTRIAAHFANVPRGVRLFVTSVSELMAPLKGQLVESESTVGEATVLERLPVHELAFENGDATVVWEVDPNSYARRFRGCASLRFPVFASWIPDPKTWMPSLGTGSVRGTLWPCVGKSFSAPDGSRASLKLPIPRFADVSTSREFLTVTYQR